MQDESTSQRRAKLRSNLPKLHVLSILGGALLLAPVLVPFFQDYGLSLSEILWLQACFGLAVAILEVPSGYFSDVVGRRPALVIGSVGLTLGFAVFAIADGFWSLLIGELVLAVGWSFISGTSSALTYDTLAELEEVERYAPIFGRQRSYANFAEAAASIVGAAIAVLSIRLPALAQIVIYAPTILLALSLTEPERKRFSSPAGPVAGIRQIILEALALRREVRALIVLSAVIATSSLTMAWLSQPWLSAADVPLVAFGVIWAGLRITVGVSALFASRLEAQLGFNRSVAVVIAVLIGGFSLCAWQQVPWLIPALASFSFVRGISMVLFSEAINRQTGSDRRATVLSLESLICRLLFAPLAPLVGWIADAYSLSTAIALSGALFGTGAILIQRCLAVPARTRNLPELATSPSAQI
ncbi:MAG: MFS transporter [Verrucomicrobiales bacterium]